MFSKEYRFVENAKLNLLEYLLNLKSYYPTLCLELSRMISFTQCDADTRISGQKIGSAFSCECRIV